MDIFLIFAGITFLGLVGYGFQVFAVRSYIASSPLNSGEGSSLPLHFPPISILKPMKGLDDNLFDNLESFCTQDYPEYEIIFSLQDRNDPAYKVAWKVKEKYPDRNISLIVERCDEGLNPKVNNLIPAYKISRYAHILISDSNVSVERDYLREIVKPMNEPEVGLVSNLIKGIGGRTIGSIFENLHLNSFIVGSVCLMNGFLGMPCVIGKSMLMRKSDLDAIGGLRAVKDLLAEDYIIGDRLHKIGKKVVLSHYVVNNVNEYWGIKKFINRHTRWGKLRWKIGGIGYFSELFSNAVFMSCLPLFMLPLSKMTLSLAVTACSLKIACDFYIGKRIKSEMNPLLYFLVPIKDIIIGCIWFVPILSTTVVWRGNRYIIGKDSVLTPFSETGIWARRFRLVAAIRTRLA